jgi:protein SCO1/2
MGKRVAFMVWPGLVLVVATLLLLFLMHRIKAQAALGPPLQVLGPVQDFTLTNQNNTPISLSDLRGHVWVADIIFTRCPLQCLRMTHQMKQLSEALPKNSQAKLVSLTTDADYDTPPILKAYAARYAEDTGRWQFLTGTKQQIAHVAVDSLKLTAVEKPAAERESPNDLFIHSTIFVVVDKQGRLRGVFDTMGEGINPATVQEQILAAVRRLEREK